MFKSSFQQGDKMRGYVVASETVVLSRSCGDPWHSTDITVLFSYCLRCGDWDQSSGAHLEMFCFCVGCVCV